MANTDSPRLLKRRKEGGETKGGVHGWLQLSQSMDGRAVVLTAAKFQLCVDCVGKVVIAVLRGWFLPQPKVHARSRLLPRLQAQ